MLVYLLVCSDDDLVLFNSDLKQTNIRNPCVHTCSQNAGNASGREGHLEGRQAVQAGEFFDVACCDVETSAVPRAAHVSFRQHTLNHATRFSFYAQRKDVESFRNSTLFTFDERCAVMWTLVAHC